MQLVRKYWLPIVLSVAVLALGGRLPSLTDSAGGPVAPAVTLQLPATYIVFSPVSRVLDALTLLANAQSVALFVSVALLVVLGVLLTHRARKRALWKRLALALLILLAGIAILESAAVFLPREMAAIRINDPDVVRVDFHSHTGASHDVRKSFNAEDNRDWHRSGGFDVAYITDHVKFHGVIAARFRNPARAGEGTSILSGVEGRYHRIMSTIMLGLTQSDTALLNRRGNLLPGTPASGLAPVTIIAIPNRNLDSVTTALRDSSVALPNLSGIELVDAAPRGLAQLDREEQRIRAIAAELGLILVAGSNNHGWGRAVAAWNLMRIPGWRALPPESVGRTIERQFRDRKRDAVTIIMRTRPRVHSASVAATLPVLAYQIVGGLTLSERVVWIGWIWLTVAVMAAFRLLYFRGT